MPERIDDIGNTNPFGGNIAFRTQMQELSLLIASFISLDDAFSAKDFVTS